MIELPKHTSHSAINSYLRCGKAFELESLKKYPTMPAWWLIAGSAVHTATEWIDTGEWDRSPEEAWELALFLEVQKARAIEPDDSLWLKAGYGARAQGYEHWYPKGAQYVRQWADKGLRWAQVELDVSMTLPSGLLIKGFIDRTARVGKTEYWFADLKSGSTRPDSDQQLGIYSVLWDCWLNREGFTRQMGFPIKAYNYMFKDDEFYEMDVSHWTLDAVDKIAQQWYRGVGDEVFIPRRGDQCARCSVSAACFLQSGDTATTREYDTLNPFYKE